MSNPWPSQSAPAFIAAPKTPTLEEVLTKWENSKKLLDEAKENEVEYRKQAFALGFGADAKEGTNTIELGNGYALKGVKKLNYNLKAPEGYKGDTVDAIDDCVDRFIKISNEGSFVAERLFKWSVNMSITEYRKLVEEADYSEPKKAMLKELEKVLTITEASPTLEIKEPKAKK